MKSIRLVPPPRTIHPASPLETLYDMALGALAVFVVCGGAVWAHHLASHKEYAMLIVLIICFVAAVFVVAASMRSAQISRDEEE